MALRQKTFIFESQSGETISPGGGFFSSQISPSIDVPPQAQNCLIQVPQVTVWNSVPNIAKDVNDKLTVTLSHVYLPVPPAFLPLPYTVTKVVTVTLPEGIYTIDSFEHTVQSLWLDALLVVNPIPDEFFPNATYFSFFPDESTGKVEIRRSSAAPGQSTTIVFNFGAVQNVHEVLGFNTTDVTLGPLNSTTYSPNRARFNNVDAFLIQSVELAGPGIPINGAYRGILARIPIHQASANQILTYEPHSPAIMSGQHLVGNYTSFASFRLLNQRLEELKNTESWSIVVTISFYL